MELVETDHQPHHEHALNYHKRANPRVEAASWSYPPFYPYKIVVGIIVIYHPCGRVHCFT